MSWMSHTQRTNYSANTPVRPTHTHTHTHRPHTDHHHHHHLQQQQQQQQAKKPKKIIGFASIERKETKETNKKKQTLKKKKGVCVCFGRLMKSLTILFTPRRT